MIKVLFFGPVADRIGARQIDVPFREALRWQDLRDELQVLHPEAFALVAIAAVNGERVGEQGGEALVDGAEVVFMSRFSGG